MHGDTIKFTGNVLFYLAST